MVCTHTHTLYIHYLISSSPKSSKIEQSVIILLLGNRGMESTLPAFKAPAFSLTDGSPFSTCFHTRDRQPSL